MSANTSSSNFPSNSTKNGFLVCLKSRASTINLFTILATYILLLPVLLSVLHLGYQRWKRQRSGSRKATTPTDRFVYHTVAIQLIEFFGFLLLSRGIQSNHVTLSEIGETLFSTTFNGKAMFHLLTCVERYLAVVHPITYLQLKQAKGVRITNIGIGCVWVFNFLTLASSSQKRHKVNFYVYISYMSSLLIGIAFCSISVLCALKRPGPGETGGNRERVDQSKQRAFYTIMSILGVLLVKFGGSLSVFLLISTHSVRVGCIELMGLFWLDLPSVLVLPLLFLHRAGKLHCGKQITASG